MREMGIAGIAPGPNLSKRVTEHRVYPYLLRGVTAQAPDHIRGCDAEYLGGQRARPCLPAVRGLCIARRVLGGVAGAA